MIGCAIDALSNRSRDLAELGSVLHDRFAPRASLRSAVEGVAIRLFQSGVQDRGPKLQQALPAVLGALLALAGATGADVFESIALAIVLLPACEAALAVRNAADEDAAPAPVFPRRGRHPRGTEMHRPPRPGAPRARAQGLCIDGRLVPLLA